jgi:two-component system response regulator YesN
MYRILIIDDEPIIVNGIFEMLNELTELKLDVCRAYSAIEGLEWLNRTKIDIVLTDISMPGMSGLELQARIVRQWPRCRVIFLTGFTQFNYIQSAMRGGGVDYILKTEGDEKIIEVIKHAIADMKNEFYNTEFIIQAKEQMKMAIPAIQKDFLLSLLSGEIPAARINSQRFKEMQLTLSHNEPTAMVVGRVDHWPESISFSDKALLLYSIQNIASEYLTQTNMIQISVEHSRFVWFYQPLPNELTALKEQASPREQNIRFVQGTLETIQQTCKGLLKLPVSFSSSSTAVHWDQVAGLYHKLLGLMNRGLGLGQEMLLMTQKELSEGASKSDKQHSKSRVPSKFKQNSILESLLESGQKAEFLELFRVMIQEIHAANLSHSLFLEWYYSIASIYLSYINRWDLLDSSVHQVDIDVLMNFHAHVSYPDAVLFLEQTACLLIDQRLVDQRERTTSVVDQINDFIRIHLDQDLSLTVLGELVYLNPSYLSRVYKQTTGISLSDYIFDSRLLKAKELLQHSHIKVNEIGRQIGFESAGYFSRFFKKFTNLSPQEYRESVKK